MNEQIFEGWLEGLKNAWETKNPQAAANLCAANLEYFETPFGEPLKTREAVQKEWESVPASQKDIRVTYKILSVNEDFGIAQWSAEFTRIPSNKKAHLEGIFKVHLDKDNLCKEFHMWYNEEL